MTEKTKKYKILLLVLVLALAIVTAFILNANTASKDNEIANDAAFSGLNKKANESTSAVTIKLNYGEKTEEYKLENVSEKTTVFDVLKKVSEKSNIELNYNNNYSFGVFIESIGGIKNGDGGKYWQYYINGVLGDAAADKKVLKEGDSVEWRFEEVPFEN